MNGLISSFDAVHPESRFIAIDETMISNGAVTLEVEPSLGDPHPERLLLTWPHGSDPSSSLYAAKLCEILLGSDNHYPGLTSRAAKTIEQHGTHTETMGDWQITVANLHGTLRLELTAQKNEVSESGIPA